jgi:hypothetical protein
VTGRRRRARTAATAIATALLAIAAPALATTATTPEAAQPTVAQAARPRRTHAGLFLRLAVGPAYMRESFSPDGGAQGASYAGSGPALAVAVGHTVLRPGLIVAGAFQSSGIFNRSETFRGVSYTLDDTLHLVDTFGALVDWYPDPRRGFHAGGALQLVVVTEVDTHMGGSLTSVGPGLSLHAGKEWFISPRWSAGVLGTVTLYHVGNDSPAPGSTSNGILPTLLAAFTFD